MSPFLSSAIIVGRIPEATNIDVLLRSLYQRRITHDLFPTPIPPPPTQNMQPEIYFDAILNKEHADLGGGSRQS